MERRNDRAAQLTAIEINAVEVHMYFATQRAQSYSLRTKSYKAFAVETGMMPSEISVNIYQWTANGVTEVPYIKFCQ